MKNRKSPRWARWDYSTEGYYFVTTVTKDRLKLFGEIQNDEMVLNEFGKIVFECWYDLPNHYPDCELDEFIIMPNHIHGIIRIIRRGQACLTPTDYTGTEKRNNERIPAMMGSFKSAVSNKIRKNGMPNFQWQRSFHDHIIRDEMELYNIRNYIRMNPKNWNEDDLKEAA